VKVQQRKLDLTLNGPAKSTPTPSKAVAGVILDIGRLDISW